MTAMCPVGELADAPHALGENTALVAWDVMGDPSSQKEVCSGCDTYVSMIDCDNNPMKEVKQMSIELDARMEEAVDKGLESFWTTIVKHFPESFGGDFDPMVEGSMYADMTAYLRHWITMNTNLISEE
jgi:hypothetical protein